VQSDLFIFGHVKIVFPGAEFPTAKELIEAVVQILSGIPLQTLIATFHQLMNRPQACIDGPGEYME
jgi:hypothetical protein